MVAVQVLQTGLVTLPSSRWAAAEAVLAVLAQIIRVVFPGLGRIGPPCLEPFPLRRLGNVQHHLDEVRQVEASMLEDAEIAILAYLTTTSAVDAPAASIYLPEASVTGTETALMAAA